jgi:hypothetical protein
MDKPEMLSIAFSIADESPQLAKLLVVGYRLDGSTFTLDSGLTVDEAKEMVQAFISWMDVCIGRDIERASREQD